LKVVPAVVHILDYTMVNTEEEKRLRDYVQQVQELAHTNLSILLNKFDQRTSGSLSKKEAIVYACNEIYPKRIVKRRFLNSIDESRVFAVSAKQAFYANLAKSTLLKVKKLPQEGWVKDWGVLAYGLVWEKYLQNSQESHLEVCDALYHDSELREPIEKIVIHSYRQIIPICLSMALENAQEIINSLKHSLERIDISIKNLDDEDMLNLGEATIGIHDQRVGLLTRIRSLCEESYKLSEEIGEYRDYLKKSFASRVFLSAIHLRQDTL
jgi:hypothetical protein